MSKLSQFFGGGGGGSAGEVRGFAGVKKDGEWLQANGSAYLKADYPDLSEVLGPRYNLISSDLTSEVLETVDGDVLNMAINKEGTLLMVLKKNSPYFAVYKVDGNDLTPLETQGVTTPSAPPTDVRGAGVNYYSFLFNNLTGALHVGNRAYVLTESGTAIEDAPTWLYTHSQITGQSPSGKFMTYGISGVAKIKEVGGVGGVDEVVSNVGMYYPFVTNSGEVYGIEERASTGGSQGRFYGNGLVYSEFIGGEPRNIYPGIIGADFASQSDGANSDYVVYYRTFSTTEMSPSGDIICVYPSAGGVRSGRGSVSTWGWLPKNILPDFFYILPDKKSALKLEIPLPIPMDAIVGFGSSVRFSDDGTYIFIGFGVRHSPSGHVSLTSTYPLLVYEVIRDDTYPAPYLSLIDTSPLVPLIEGNGPVSVETRKDFFHLSTEKGREILGVGIDIDAEEFRVPVLESDPYFIMHVKT